MESHPDRWREEVSPMQSHCDKRKTNQPLWNAEQINVVDYLRKELKLDRFTEEEIHRACGILETNCFEILTPQGNAFRGVYPKTAILSHSCVANTAHSISRNNFKLELRTTTGVAEGEELFCSYTGSLQTTLVRRDNLAQTKNFWCDCPRCADPTELSTHLSTLKCTKCDNGVISSTNPLDQDAPWKCSHCEFGINGNGVRRILAAIQAEIDEVEVLEMSPEKLQLAETVLKKYKIVLHPHHALNVSIWYLLIQMYGRVQNYTINDLPNILLERKIDLCQKFLLILDKVEPGYTRMRGLTLFELHVTLLTLARSQYSDGHMSKSELKAALENVVTILSESVKILSLEPSGCPERQLAVASSHSLQQLKQSILSISDN